MFTDHQDSFHYLNQGGSPEIDGVDDLRAFNETKNALTTLGKLILYIFFVYYFNGNK